MAVTTNIGLPFMDAAVRERSLDYNEGARIVDAVMHLSVISDALTTPPVSPAEGDRYLVAATATGAWAGWEGRIAAFLYGAWDGLVPQDGWRCFVQSSNRHIIFNGGWIAAGAADFRIEFAGRPLAAEVMGKIPTIREITVPANFAGSYGFVEATPGAPFNIDVQDDGVSIGAASISTGGLVTFTTVGGTTKTIAAGSKITFIAPAADAAILDISITFLGWA